MIRRGILLAVLIALAASGCSSNRSFPKVVDEPADIETPGEGVIHFVEKGQTLWRIARAYGVPVETLAVANQLKDATQIRVGQALTIPGASRVLDVPPAPSLVPGSGVPAGPPPSSGSRDERVSTQGWAWPLDGQVISRFGTRRSHGRHKGVDLRARSNTPIQAARDGEVTFAGVQRGFGKLVVISHPGGYSSWYAHARKLEVRVGQRVRRGQVIARSGATGNAQGPHLHFEIRREGRALDPLVFLP